MGSGARSTITALTSSHLPACANLYAETFNRPPWDESWTVANAQRRLSDFLATPRSLGVCAVEGESQVIGFALGHLERSCDDDHFLLQEMCVHADLQRQGRGAALLHALDQRIPEGTRWYLLTARNSEAAAFYQRSGFRPAGRMGVFVRP